MIRKKGGISLAPFSLSEVMVESNYLNCNIASPATFYFMPPDPFHQDECLIDRLRSGSAYQTVEVPYLFTMRIGH